MKVAKTAVQEQIETIRANRKAQVTKLKELNAQRKAERAMLVVMRAQATKERVLKTALRVVALAARKVATQAKREVAIERAKARLAKLLEDKQPKAGAAAIREAKRPSKVIVTKYDTSRGRDASGQGPSW